MKKTYQKLMIDSLSVSTEGVFCQSGVDLYSVEVDVLQNVNASPTIGGSEELDITF